MPMPKNWRDPKEIADLGWRKEVIYEFIRKERGKGYVHIKQKYTIERSVLYVCRSCRSKEYMFLRVMPSGVFVSCVRCGITSGPIGETDPDSREPVCETIERRENVSLDEAVEVVLRTKQIPPDMKIRRLTQLR